MQRHKVHHDGKDIEVWAQKLQGKLWFHLDGETHVFSPISEKRQTKGGLAPKSNLIEAPMPGKILRVEVKIGDRAKPGQVLIVMEAMKMEYTLASAIEAEVQEVGCQPNDQVKLGQLLVRLKGPS